MTRKVETNKAGLTCRHGTHVHGAPAGKADDMRQILSLAFFYWHFFLQKLPKSLLSDAFFELRFHQNPCWPRLCPGWWGDTRPHQCLDLDALAP